MYVVNFGYNIKCTTIGISKNFPLNLCGEIMWSIYLTLKNPLIAFAFTFLGWLLFLFDISIFQFDKFYNNISYVDFLQYYIILVFIIVHDSFLAQNHLITKRETLIVQVITWDFFKMIHLPKQICQNILVTMKMVLWFYALQT